MKKFIALAVLVTSIVSYAASDIYDVMYLPGAGTTYGITEGSMIKMKSEADSGDTEIDGYVVEQTIGHAFTDQLSLAASLDYTKLEADPDGGTKFDYTKGVSDPTLTAKFRLMQETYRWDLLGGALISLGDSEIKSNGAADNRQGGHSLFVGTQFGAKTESFQWAVSGQFVYNMKATVDDKFAESKYENDTNNELLFRGDILNQLGEKSFLRSFATVNFAEEFEDDDTPPGTTPSRTIYEIGLEYQHLMSRDLLLKAGVSYLTINTQSGLIDSWNAWGFNIAANYQF